MEKLLIDTGAFLGRQVVEDQHHEASLCGWREIESSSMRVHSTEHIFDETVGLLSRRNSYAFAAEWGMDHLQSRELDWLQATPEDLKIAIAFMRKYADQKVSFTDCVSFALMRREGIRHAFSFDHHFLDAQFRLWPGY